MARQALTKDKHLILDLRQAILRKSISIEQKEIPIVPCVGTMGTQMCFCDLVYKDTVVLHTAGGTFFGTRQVFKSSYRLL